MGLKEKAIRHVRRDIETQHPNFPYQYQRPPRVRILGCPKMVGAAVLGTTLPGY